jgi:hypothetical protein
LRVALPRFHSQSLQTVVHFTDAAAWQSRKQERR